MKKFIIIFLALFIANNTFANTYIEQTIDWKKVRIIEYDLLSKDFTFKIGINDYDKASTLQDLMERNNGISAVNWVFFCPADYSSCWWKNYTINERYVNWEKYAWYEETWDRVVFAITKENIPFLFQTNKINSTLEKQIYNWVWNYPVLLKDWEPQTEFYRDIWLIDSKMKAAMSRNFICSDKAGKKLYFWYVSSIELDALPWILLKIECYNALNLDAWVSSAMMYNWRYIIWPWRDIMDWLIIERNGLDTQKSRDLSIKIMENINAELEDKPVNYQTWLTEWLLNKLKDLRSKIYEENSIDLVNENWIANWYKIEINDIETLSRMYSINYLYDLVNTKKKEIQAKIKEEEKKS